MGGAPHGKHGTKAAVGRKYTMDDSGNSYYGINICAEYLDRPFEEICSTLLHEMRHFYNKQSGVQDTCRNGLYRNKHFKWVT